MTKSLSIRIEEIAVQHPIKGSKLVDCSVGIGTISPPTPGRRAKENPDGQ
jgi:hypothetical protein